MKSRLFAFALAAVMLPSLAWGQGMLVDLNAKAGARMPRVADAMFIMPRPRPIPQPANSYKIRELKVDVNLQGQIAKVQVAQTFVNTGSRQMEVSFVFPLPYDGAVDRMTFMVDGKEYEAELMTADQARTIYEGYMRRNMDPALMEWMGSGLFKTSVFPVPAGAERTVSMRYSQICKKSAGLTELMIPLATAKYTSQPVEKVSVNVNVQGQAEVKNVYSPTHNVSIERPSDIQAVVKFESANEVPSSDFRLMYDTAPGPLAASVLSYRPDTDEDGFFVLLASPDVQGDDPSDARLAQRKTVVFVVDRSGSMSGKKMDQAKDSLKFVLNNLAEGDLFNIVAYDSVVETFQPELQKFNNDTRKQALGFVEGIYAGGATNISGALESAFGMIQDDSQPSYVVFLTDGLPTQGETKEPKIVTDAAQQNKTKARVFTMGVGYDVNSRLLDKLARSGFGQSEYVRPNEDIEEHVARLYNRIGSPAMSNVKIAFDQEGFGGEKGSPVNRVYPREVYDLFIGDQLVVVGRYKQAGDIKVRIDGTVNGEKKSFDFPATWSKHSPNESYAFAEKLWAMRRVGEIIDDIDLNGKNEELVDELVHLSSKHGIITPYTSFLADDQPGNMDLAAARRQAGVALDALEAADGVAGFAQREAKQNFKNAPQAPAGGAVEFQKSDADEKVVLNTVRRVGRKTFYLRGDRWVDAEMNAELAKTTQKIERFSDDYFKLAKKLGRDAARYLAIEAPVTIVLNGQAYEL